MKSERSDSKMKEIYEGEKSLFFSFSYFGVIGLGWDQSRTK